MTAAAPGPTPVPGAANTLMTRPRRTDPVIYEAAIPFGAGLRHVALADPSAPLPPTRRHKPAPEPAHRPLPEMTAALREALVEEAEQVERGAREEREQLESVLANLTDVARDLRAQQRTRLEEMQRVAVELAVAVASHVLYERLDAGDYPVEALVRRAVKRLEANEAVTVRLHPDDLALLERRLGEGALFALDGDEVRLTADPALGRGDCRAETGDISVVSHLEEHLEEIRRELLRSLPEAEVERRGGVAEERGLRRYPDRRHTA